jgi:aminoglycoside phosphotransferase (APT) family kinase protein
MAPTETSRPRSSASPGRTADAPAETIAVREDERFDEALLQGWLRGRLEGAELPLAVEQFGGGHANLTYLLRFGEGEVAREYVLRRPPLGPVAPGSHDMAREYRALSVLWQAFPEAPRAYVYCDDPTVIGAPFFVMERRHGIVVRGAVPEVYGGGRDERANRKLSEVVIDTLARFHAVDPEPIGLDALGRDPARFLERQVKGWADRYERSKIDEVREAEEVVAWLLAEMPASPEPTLLHNDWKLDNMALDPGDPGRCVAVYDWDMCTVGDPLCDLGTVLALWSNPGQGPAGTNPMPTQSPGFMTREEAVARYGAQSGRDVSGAAYYDVFGTFKMGVVLQQIYFRYRRGQTRDERFAGLGAAARNLYELASQRRP